MTNRLSKDGARTTFAMGISTVSEDRLKRTARRRQEFADLGKSGLGKTVALNWIVAQTGADYCEVAQHTKAIRPMFLMLHDDYGIQRDSKHTYDLAKDSWRENTGSRFRGH